MSISPLTRISRSHSAGTTMVPEAQLLLPTNLAKLQAILALTFILSLYHQYGELYLLVFLTLKAARGGTSTVHAFIFISVYIIIQQLVVVRVLYNFTSVWRMGLSDKSFFLSKKKRRRRKKKKGFTLFHDTIYPFSSLKKK